MLWTCFSTVCSVMKSCWAIALFERPSAISASTFALTIAEVLERVRSRARPLDQLRDHGRVEHRASFTDAADAARELVEV